MVTLFLIIEAEDFSNRATAVNSDQLLLLRLSFFEEKPLASLFLCERCPTLFHQPPQPQCEASVLKMYWCLAGITALPSHSISSCSHHSSSSRTRADRVMCLFHPEALLEAFACSCNSGQMCNGAAETAPRKKLILPIRDAKWRTNREPRSDCTTVRWICRRRSRTFSRGTRNCIFCRVDFKNRETPLTAGECTAACLGGHRTPGCEEDPLR